MSLARRHRGLGDATDDIINGIVDPWVYTPTAIPDTPLIDPFNTVTSDQPSFWPTMPPLISSDPFATVPVMPGITPGTQLVPSPGALPFTLDVPSGTYTQAPSWLQQLVTIGTGLLTKAAQPKAPLAPVRRVAAPAPAGAAASLLSGSTPLWLAAAAIVGYSVLTGRRRGGRRSGGHAYRGRRRRRR